jgi:predicted esterase
MSAADTTSWDPHAAAPVERAGPPLQTAAGAIILLHGRGATASSILELHRWLSLPSLAAMAPQATGNSWYPDSFLAPLERNQPQLDSALAKVAACIEEAAAAGLQPARLAIAGFSQGACLACEFAARNPRRYGAVIAFTGGLIGPDDAPRDYPGSLDEAPVFLGSGDPDPHVPFARVLETQAVLQRMGAIVEIRRYPGMPHTVNEEELALARGYLQRMIAAEPAA